MKKLLFTYFLMFSVIGNTFGEKKITISEKEKNESSQEKKYIGTINNISYFYQLYLKGKNSAIKISQYDEKYILIKSYDITTDGLDKKTEIPLFFLDERNFLIKDDKILFVYTQSNYKEKTSTIKYCDITNSADLTKSKIILNANPNYRGAILKENDVDRFWIFKYETGENKPATLIAMDLEFNILDQVEINEKPLHYAIKGNKVYTFHHNKESINTSLTVPERIRNCGLQYINYYDIKEGFQKKITLSYSPEQVIDYQYHFNSTDELVLDGLYSDNPEKISNVSGLFRVRIKNDEVISINKYSFESTISSKIKWDEFLPKKSTSYLKAVDLKEVINNEDGSSIIFLELNSTNIAPSGMYTYSGDLIFFKLSSEDKIDWTTIIRNKQQGGHLYSPIYILGGNSITVNNKLHIYTLDTKSNENKQGKDNPELLNVYTSANLVDYTLNQDGSFSSEILLNMKDVKTFINPNLSYKISDSKVLFLGFKGYNQQGAVVEY